MEEWITVQEAAERKGVPAATIYAAIGRGTLPATTVLGRKVLTGGDLAAYEPGSYAGAQRAKKPRGPGRPATRR